MTSLPHNGHRSAPASLRRVPAFVIAVTLLILGGVICLTHLRLRSAMREQISRRDAQVLQALWLNERAGDRALGTFGPATDAADYLVPLLQTNQFRKLPSVKGTRLFDAGGKLLIAFPDDLPDAELPPADLAALRNLNVESRFLPHVRPSDLSMFAEKGQEETPLPLLEIILPLHAPDNGKLLGAAQFLFDGSSIAGELAALDRNLTRQAVVTFVAVGLLLALVLGAAFRQLQKANSLLAQRTQSLLRANEELALAAKTSAIGSVTAHLIHGLKNPLAGLQSFMSVQAPPDAASADEWREAVLTTRRMQSLIGDTVRVLREQEGVAEYELSIDDVVELISGKIRPAAQKKTVHLRTAVAGGAQLNNRTANLIVLILENLLSNGIQATPPGGEVRLEISAGETGIRCQVCDQGPGFPEHLKESLFTPCTSTKEGGSGIGLSISKQLANSIGAELELARSDASGCVFTLRMSIEACSATQTGEASPSLAARAG